MGTLYLWLAMLMLVAIVCIATTLVLLAFLPKIWTARRDAENAEFPGCD